MTEVEMKQFRWGAGKQSKANKISELAVKIGAVRVRGSEIALIGGHLGYDMNSNSGSWMARKYWKWYRVPTKFGSIYVHPDHYTNDEEEREIAKKNGYHDRPRHDFVEQFLSARAE